MPKYKNYDQREQKKDMKNLDADKNNENGIQHISTDILMSSAGAASAQKKKNRARKKLPLAVDIIIAILMVAIVVGAVIGAYFVFRYFTVDYESVTVEYTLLVDTDDVASYSGLINKHVYMDSEESTTYFGKIIGCETFKEDGAVLLKVAINAKYRSEEGYYADDCKIAVGNTMNVRTDSKKISGTVVELVKKSSPKKVNSALDFLNNSATVFAVGGVE